MGGERPTDVDAVFRRFSHFAAVAADFTDSHTLLRYVAEAACSVPDGVEGTVVMVPEDDHLRAAAAHGRGTERVIDRRCPVQAVPGAAALQQGDPWVGAPEDAPRLASDAADWVAALPATSGGRLVAVLYAFGLGAGPARVTMQALELIGARLATALEREALQAALRQRNRQLSKVMEITVQIAQSLDFSAVAERIVQGVTAVTDFRVATLTLREGATCRRVAASGLEDEQIDLETPSDSWTQLLRPEHRVAENTYLIPPAGEEVDASAPRPQGTPGTWRPGQGMTVTLYAPEGDLVGFLSVDEPRSGRLPAPELVEFLELFARQVQVAFVNARLYGELKRASQRDSLTGLRNRAAFWEDIPEVLARSAGEAPVALAVIDADGFKAINDTHGHVVGDQVLMHVADRVQRSVRQTDGVYRIGGEEFTILMPSTTAEEGCLVMDRARTAVRRARADLPPITISAGVAEFPRHATSGDGLFTAADAAMYAAKRGGRDAVAVAEGA